MEEIIQIVVFVAAMAIAAIVKSSKGKEQPATPSPQDILEEVFPSTSHMQPKEESLQAQPVRPIKTKRVPRKANSPIVEPQETPSATLPRPKSSIKLNTRAEARKAFIHSEIFNRKYQ